MSKIIGVRFCDQETGEPRGRVYNYYDGVGNLAVGDLVVATVRDEEKTVQVTAVDVPESKIGDRILALLKTISKRYVPQESPPETSDEEIITMEDLDNA
ncbi:MAG: hypothetical protein FWE08_03605 [Oscillospiraceae bacterium]|nr:hypothetical protein [Oscillospiraceae bacterium]